MSVVQWVWDYPEIKTSGLAGGFDSACQKRALPFFDKRDFAPTRASVCASAHEHTLSAQSIFRDVHAAAKNGLNFIRGLWAANSARLF